MVPTDGGERICGNVGKERRATHVGEEGASRDLAVLRELRDPDPLSGDSEPPREGHESVRTATRNVNSTEEVLGDSPGYRIVVGYKGYVWYDATRDGSGELRRGKGIEGEHSLFGTRLDDKTVGLGVDGSRPRLSHMGPSMMIVSNTRILRPHVSQA